MKQLSYKNDIAVNASVRSNSLADSNDSSNVLATETLNTNSILRSTSVSSLVGMKNEEDKTALDIAKDSKHGPLIIR